MPKVKCYVVLVDDVAVIHRHPRQVEQVGNVWITYSIQDIFSSAASAYGILHASAPRQEVTTTTTNDELFSFRRKRQQQSVCS
jgi:hypothetical protein